VVLGIVQPLRPLQPEAGEVAPQIGQRPLVQEAGPVIGGVGQELAPADADEEREELPLATTAGSAARAAAARAAWACPIGVGRPEGNAKRVRDPTLPAATSASVLASVRTSV
jgi:hypothetical protein